MQIQLTREITEPYSTTSVISGLFYTSYFFNININVKYTLTTLLACQLEKITMSLEKITKLRRGIWADIPRYAYREILLTSYSYNSISRYAYSGISAHIPQRDLVIFCVLISH